MARKSSRPDIQGHVTLTQNGRTYKASWGVAHGVITVWNFELGERSTQVGGSQAGGEEVLGRLLLSDMIPE